MNSILMLVLGDMLLSVAAVYAGAMVRFGSIEVLCQIDFLQMLIFVGSSAFISSLLELYNMEKHIAGRELLLRILIGIAGTFLTISAVSYLLHVHMFYRGMLVATLFLFGLFQYLWHIGFVSFMNPRPCAAGAGPRHRSASSEDRRFNREHEPPAHIDPIVTHMRHYLHSESKERERILRTVGERIFRPKTYEVGDVRITTLGGVQEVGRSAFLLQTRESSVLLDWGTNPGSSRPFGAFPRFDIPTFELDSLDAVVISHAHLDHCGLVPFLYKYGYDGPVYCSAPTSNLMTLLQLDYLDVAGKQGATPHYDQRDVRECVLHTNHYDMVSLQIMRLTSD